MYTHVFFSVAIEGKHLFRTDWYSELDGVDNIRDELIRAFPAVAGYTIRKYMRDESMECVDIDNLSGR